MNTGLTAEILRWTSPGSAQNSSGILVAADKSFVEAIAGHDCSPFDVWGALVRDDINARVRKLHAELTGN